MLAMILYAAVLGGLGIVGLAGASALREAVRRKARPRGFLVAVGAILLSLAGFWMMLI